MMDCMHAMAPDEEEMLSVVLDDEVLSSDKMSHLEQCEICHQRLATYQEYQQVNDALVDSLYRSQCPDALQLSLYCEGLLLPDDRVSIASHILDCPLCAAEVATTRSFMADVEPVPPPSFSLSSAVRRVMGTLVRQQAQLVLRSNNDSATKGWPRQYRAEDIDLSLHLSRTSTGNIMLLGILTSINNSESVDTFEGVQAELYAAPYTEIDENIEEEKSLLSTAVDDLGNLVFTAVPAGTYNLIVHLSDCDVVIEDVTVEAN